MKDFGGGFLGLLTITLVILKALGYINISWLWVFAPVWLPVSLLAVLFLIAGAVAVTQELKK